MRIAALSLLILSSVATAAEAKQATAGAANMDTKADTQKDKKPSPAKPKVQSSVAETMTLETAMALKLNHARALGLTVYKGKALLRPGLTVLGLPSKLPEPVMPGQDETAPESMPPSPDGDKNQPSDGSVDASTEAK